MKYIMPALAVATVSSVSALAQDSKSVSEAQSASSAWLALMDCGKYSDSWSQASGLLKSAVNEASWSAAVQRVRVRLVA